MSIIFVTGKPGAGKGLVAVQEIVNELVLGKRPIVTNLALKIEPWIGGDFCPRLGLRAYLMREYGKDYDVSKRVFVVPDEQIERFYLLRRLNEDGRSVLKAADVVLGSKGEEQFATELGFASGGHLYVVDEAWNFWSARKWQKTGDLLLFYNAQHRKFSDDVFIVTQHTKQIDPAVHRLAQEFWQVKNHSKMSIGPFRRPGVFTVSIYENAPTGSMQTAMNTRTFKLDATGLAQCYDTSAGVGLSGRGVADVGARKRGLPFWLLPVGVAALVLLGWYLLRGGAWLAGHELARSVSAPHKLVGSVFPSAPPVVFPPMPALVQSELKPTPGFPSLYCSGYCIDGNLKDYVIFMSDGTTITTRSGRVHSLDRDSVNIDGVTFPVRHYVCPASVKQVASVSVLPETPVFTGAGIHNNSGPLGSVRVTPAIGGSH